MVIKERQMFNGIFRIPLPANEPCLQYTPGSPERAELSAKLKEMLGRQVEVPMVIGGEEVCSGKLADIRYPHDHHHVPGKYHQADAEFVIKAVGATE
jgi:1-pyrroline-5-carboxylate dehydrogenase